MGNKVGKNKENNKEKNQKANEDNNLNVDEKNDENGDAFFLEDWQVLNGKANRKTSDAIKFDSNLIISEIKKDPFIDYTKVKELGEGSFGKVLKVKHNITGVVRAMKVIEKENPEKEDIDIVVLNEINILRKLDHPYIVKIFEFYIGKENYYLVTEFCEEGDLYDSIDPNIKLDEIEIAYIMYQIFTAVNHCHKVNIMHRDLKLENILVKSKENNFLRLAICDFGISKIFQKGQSKIVKKEKVGTLYYMAPEVLLGEYTDKYDLWSCGVIMYILVTGILPFGGNKSSEVKFGIIANSYDTKKLNDRSKNCVDLINKLLEKSPEKRISAEEALNHPFFDDHKSNELLNEIKDKKIIEKFIDNIKHYKIKSILQETVLAYLVHNFPNLEDVINAGKLFGKIDIKGKGKVSLDEFFTHLSYVIQSDELRKDIVEIFNCIDTDQDNYIGYEEFVRAAVDKSIFLSDNILKFAFDYFDKNKEGVITFDGIAYVFGDHILSENIPDALRKIISEVDKDGDGKIQFNEFRIMMENLLIKDN